MTKSTDGVLDGSTAIVAGCQAKMEAHSPKCLMASRCKARSGLKKALSLEAARLPSHERVQQRPPLECRFGEQNDLVEVTKISSKDPILQRTGPDCAEDGGAVSRR